MAEKEYLLTQSQELTINELMEQDVYIALLQDNSLGHDQLNFCEEYSEENNSHVLQQSHNNSQLLPEHVSQLISQDVSHQLYQPQTPNNYANQSNNYNSQLMPFNPSDHLPLPVNYLPPINRSFQQVNQVKMPPIISTEDYAGPYNFDVYFDPVSVRNPWLYSSALEKLFITMGDCFPVDFRRDCDVKQDLYVRATTLYVSPQLNQEIVVRCLSHTTAASPHNLDIPEHVKNHVLRCQDSNSNYQGEAKKKQHLSVVVPLGLPQPGTDVVRLIYYFVCKNSCPAGINRRHTCVIFTLEDKFGAVMGRRRVNVRVCSCPKRDKEKEEKDAQSGPAPRGKKRKLEKVDKREVIVDESSAIDNKEQKLNLTIYGKQTKLLILNAAYDRLSGEINRHGSNENFRKSLTEIEEQIKKCEE